MAGSSQRVKVETCEIKHVGWKPYELKSDFNYSAVERVGHFLVLPGSLERRIGNRCALMILNIVTNKWRKVVTQGKLTKIFLHDDKLLSFGAPELSTFADTEFAVTSEYDFLLQEMTVNKVEGTAPPPRNFSTSGLIAHKVESKVVIFGGMITGVELPYQHRVLTNEVLLFDVQHKRWLEPIVKGTPPRERWLHTSCVHMGLFYCYGGRDYANNWLQDGIFVLHLAPGNVTTWSSLKSSGIDRVPASFCNMLLFENTILFFTATGFFKYDRQSGWFSLIAADINGRSWLTSFLPSKALLENDNVYGIFWPRGTTTAYLRVSLVN